MGKAHRPARVATPATHSQRQDRLLSAGVEIEHARGRLVFLISGRPVGGEGSGGIPDTGSVGRATVAGAHVSYGARTKTQQVRSGSVSAEHVDSLKVHRQSPNRRSE